MPKFDGQFFDADNHYYESHDAFTRHVPKAMQSRCVQWVTMENGRKYHSIAGKIDRWVILQSIKMLSVHRAKGHATRLTVNLTCNSIADPEFLQWLTVAIKAARLPSDAVIFQVTDRIQTRLDAEFPEARTLAISSDAATPLPTTSPMTMPIESSSVM